MGKRCRECKRGMLKIVGLGPYEDTIEVECEECGESYEVEPDGLGEGGLEMMEAYEVEQKRVRAEEAAEARAAKQVYGFTIPDAVKTFWSARAIYTLRSGEVNIDILPDRQVMNGDEDKSAATDLVKWLNEGGLAGLQSVCQSNGIQPDEARVVEYRSEGNLIAGNPNGSYGYLYLVAYKEPSPC